MPSSLHPKNGSLDFLSTEPVAEYIVCWLLSHAGRWAGNTQPTISAQSLCDVFTLAEQQIHHSWSGQTRSVEDDRDGDDQATAEAAVASARETLALLAATERGRSVGVRFPIEPVLWRAYTASIYEPLAPELEPSLGFNLETLEQLRFVMRGRAKKHLIERLADVRAFVKRADAGVKRLRRGRLLKPAIEEPELAMFHRLSLLSPTESKHAIRWHATLRILDGAAHLVEVSEDDQELRASLGEGPLRAFIERCSVKPRELDRGHYELPNPSPELHFRPLVRLGSRTLLTNPIMVDYYADNIIWTAIQNPVVRKKIEARRSRFTEEKAAECLRLVFASDLVHENVGVYDPEDKRQVGEFDVLVVSTAGVVAVECKSARWSRSAQRGSIDRIRREMKELYFRPLEQLGDRLEQVRSNPTIVLRTVDGQELKVDWTSAPRFIGIIVHLDPIDSLQASPSSAPDSIHESSLDALLLCGLPYLDSACNALRSPGFLLDYLLQRGRLSADKRASAEDENVWLARYFEDRLRLATFSDMGATLGFIQADTSALDKFVRSGFRNDLRPVLPIPEDMVSVIESIDDYDFQYRVAAVVMEQSGENYMRMELWGERRGRTNPAVPSMNALFVIYSAGTEQAVAMYVLSDPIRSARSGAPLERCREMLASNVLCTSCIMVVAQVVGGALRARETFEVLTDAESE